MKFNLEKMFKSLRHAYNGLKQCIAREQNFRIELFVSALVVLLGIYFRISQIEWLWLMISICLVLSSEVMNTSIERLTDLVADKRKTNLAKQAKDVAAGAVLICVFHSLIAGVAVFLPKILSIIKATYS
ncbi:MAG: diacylglycerol kinase family protein [Candidatus Caenarcaniphilales bacterium]|nr:diacylglycerol kinase family protein [Candidatus Caenarcaniphilales bacterium]